MEEQAVIDRVEEGRFAVLLVGEAQTERVVPLDELPAGVRAGTWLRVRFESDRLVDAQIDADATRQASARIAVKMQRLRQRGRRLGQDSQE